MDRAWSRAAPGAPVRRDADGVKRPASGEAESLRPSGRTSRRSREKKMQVGAIRFRPARTTWMMAVEPGPAPRRDTWRARPWTPISETARRT